MNAPVKVVVAGCGGKMGRALVEGAGADKALTLAAAFDVGDDAAAAIAKGDVVIDFTRPEGTLAHLAHCERLGKAMVIGTTGLGERE